MMMNNSNTPFQQTGETVRAIVSEHMDCFAVTGFDAENGMPILVINVTNDPKAIIALKSMLTDCTNTLNRIMESMAQNVIAKQSNDGEPPMFSGIPQ